MWFCFSLQSSQLSSHIIIHLCMQEDQKVREEFIYLVLFFMYILQAEFVLDFDNSWRLISAQVKLNFLYIYSRSSNVIPAN